MTTKVRKTFYIDEKTAQDLRKHAFISGRFQSEIVDKALTIFFRENIVNEKKLV